MKKHIFILYTLVLIFFTTTSLAAKQTSKTLSLNQKIDRIIANSDKSLNIGILVKDVYTGKILYQKNAHRYFMPASNEKLFTAFAGLQYLRPNFIYQTRLFADPSKIVNGTLKDNVYLQFSGDPTFTFAKLERLISNLSQKGIHHIDGKIIVDDSAFDQSFASPGTSWDDNYFYFGAPLSALIIDHNAVKATITPSKIPDQPALITFPNQPQFMYFINRVKTNPSTTATCKLDVEPINESSYQINGCVKTTDAPKDIIMAIHNPRTNIQSILLHLLKRNQITYQHSIEFQKTAPDAKLLASELSAPLSILIKEMLKESDNMTANSLFKTIGQTYSHHSGSWVNGSEATQSILNNALKLTLPKSTMIDGAGCSRYNYITPQQTVTLLHKAYLSNHAAIFIDSLPISGIDGTLKDRMNNAKTRGAIRAKTGTMNAVTSLSGYLKTNKNHTLIFSILINGFVDSPAKYKALEDQLCAALVET